MTTFNFDALAADHALHLEATDVVLFAGGPANAASVTYNPLDSAGATITVTFAGHTATFDSSLIDVAANNGLRFVADNSHLVIGGAGADVAGADRVFGLVSANDMLFRGDDALFGGAGADTLNGGEGRNLIQGNAGNDSIAAGAGPNTIFGGQGDDVIIVGSQSDDTIFGSSFDRANFVQGNRGDDTIQGGDGGDTLLGGQGDDNIFGGTGPGVVNGNLGNDTLTGAGQVFGETGDDSLSDRGFGDDTLSGGDGSDVLRSFIGLDSLSGDAGADTIIAGNNVADQVISLTSMSGGPGADLFILNPEPHLSLAHLHRIVDWSGSEDSVSFPTVAPNPADFTTSTAADFSSAERFAQNLVTTSHFHFVAIQVGADVILFAGGSAGLSGVVDLVGRSLADISAHNII